MATSCSPAMGTAVQRSADVPAADAGQPPLPHARCPGAHRGSLTDAVRPRTAGSRSDHAGRRRPCRKTRRCWSWQGRYSTTRRARRRSGGPGLPGRGGAPALSRCTAGSNVGAAGPVLPHRLSSLLRGRGRCAWASIRDLAQLLWRSRGQPHGGWAPPRQRRRHCGPCASLASRPSSTHRSHAGWDDRTCCAPRH